MCLQPTSVPLGDSVRPPLRSAALDQVAPHFIHVLEGAMPDRTPESNNRRMPETVRTTASTQLSGDELDRVVGGTGNNEQIPGRSSTSTKPKPKKP